MFIIFLIITITVFISCSSIFGFLYFKTNIYKKRVKNFNYNNYYVFIVSGTKTEQPEPGKRIMMEGVKFRYKLNVKNHKDISPIKNKEGDKLHNFLNYTITKNKNFKKGNNNNFSITLRVSNDGDGYKIIPSAENLKPIYVNIEPNLNKGVWMLLWKNNNGDFEKLKEGRDTAYNIKLDKHYKLV